MPYRIKHVKGGDKPYKIMRYKNGKWSQVGESETREKAQSSINARLGAEHGWKPTGKK